MVASAVQAAWLQEGRQLADLLGSVPVDHRDTLALAVDRIAADIVDIAGKDCTYCDLRNPLLTRMSRKSSKSVVFFQFSRFQPHEGPIPDLFSVWIVAEISSRRLLQFPILAKTVRLLASDRIRSFLLDLINDSEPTLGRFSRRWSLFAANR